MSKKPVIAQGLFSYQIGGSERVGVDLALEFARRGYEVVCFAFYDSRGPMRDQLEKAGLRCVDLNYERFGRFTRRFAYQYEFWKFLRREQVSALHVHHATALILCGIPAHLVGTRRVVMTEHGLHQLKERPAYRKSAERYCRFAHEITVVEPAQADYFESAMNVPRSKLHYVANGVRINKVTQEQKAAVRASLNIAPDAFAFFYVGRLNPVKDIGTLMRAFAKVASTVQRAELHIVGDGMERDKLELLRVELGLESRIRFWGARDDVHRVLLAADAFVMSSITEGLPMAILEAMASGLPCVATGVGGIPQLFAEERGLLAPAQDPDALAAQMERLATDASLRTTLVSNAMRCVEQNYSLDVVTDQYLKLLGLPPRWPQ